jgi:hypothetical protein
MNPDPAVMKSEEAARQSGPESQRTQSHDSAGRRALQAVVNWYEWADPLGVVFAAAIASLALLLVAGLAR